MKIHTGNIAAYSSYGATLTKLTTEKQTYLGEIQASGDVQASAGPMVIPLEEIIMPVERNITEHNGVENYKDLLKDPHAFRDQAKASYEEFYAQASDIVARLENMDKTESFNISFTIAGVVVRQKEDADVLPGGQAWNDQKRIDAWIDDNDEDIKNIADKGRDYAFAQAYIDYSSETGVTRNDAVRAKKTVPYIGMVIRYALNSYGPNAMTHDEIKDTYGSAEFRYARTPNKYHFDRNDYFDNSSNAQSEGIRPGSLFNINT